MSHSLLHPPLTNEDISGFLRSPKIDSCLSDHTRSLKISYDGEVHKTSLYDHRISVIRRGTHFRLSYLLNDSSINHKNISVCFHTMSKNTEYKFELNSEMEEKHKIRIEKIELKEKTLEYVIRIGSRASIGMYHISMKTSSYTVSSYKTIFVVFNPFHKEDDVYCVNEKHTKEFLLKTSTKIYTGNDHNRHFIKYDLHQFSIECITVCAYFLNHMDFQERSDVVLVSRDLTAKVNANDEGGLMHGNWDHPTDGRSSISWRSAREIYHSYITQRTPVKWGQCFVFSMLMTSMSRCIGIATRSVTGFSIGHDHDGDGIVTVNINSETMENLESSEIIWNFHCWNQSIFIRRDISMSSLHVEEHSTKAISWQHLDGTPQARSQGIFRAGPFPVDLIKKQMFKAVPYDGEFINGTINCKVLYRIINKFGHVIKIHEKSKCGRIILTSNENGLLENITSHYRLLTTKVPKPVAISNKLILKFTHPQICNLYEDIKFHINVQNATPDTSNILNLRVRLVNHAGKSILNAPVYSKFFLFRESSFSISEEIKARNIKIRSSYEILKYAWELKYFDHSQQTFKVKHFETEINPPISGEIILPKATIFTKSLSVKLKVSNTLYEDMENVHLKVIYDKRMYFETYRLKLLEARDEVTIPITLHFKNHGKQSLEFYILSKFFEGVIDRKKIEVSDS